MEIGGHHRRQQTRDDQRGKHGDGSGDAELAEDKARYAAHERRRQEDRDQREGGCDNGKSDLVGRFEGGIDRPLAHLEVAGDVLDLDDGIVDEDADHERQRKQRDDIQAEAGEIHDKEGRYDRQGQRHGRQDRRPPVPEEKPDDDDRQDRAFVQHVHRTIIVADDRADRAVSLVDLNVGMLGGELPNRLVHIGGNTAVGKSVRALDLDRDHRLAVEIGHRGALGEAVGDGCDVIEANLLAVCQGDFEPLQRLDRWQGAERAQGLAGAADFAKAARYIRLHCLQLRRHGGRGDPERRHRRGIEIHMNLTVDPADAVDLPDTGHRKQRLGQIIVDKPGKFGLVESGRADGIGDQCGTLYGDLADARRLHLRRQVALDAVDGIADFVQRRFAVFFQLEGHFDRDGAVGDRRGDMVEIAERGKTVLDGAGHLGFELRRCGAVERSGDGDCRKVHVGEVLYRQLPEGQEPTDCQHHKQQYRRYGIADRPG